MKKIVDILHCCATLHNFFNQSNTNPIPQEWYDEVAREVDWNDDIGVDSASVYHNLRDDEMHDGVLDNENHNDMRAKIFDSIIMNFK